ncbi:hypothetical protein QFC22_001747 [Naganishia vaughanmartiniae]|uniref:Uncharacterized protein n=1 Tax=Naganishia vaughanmartiniae TaxID=1424756 RepID=A0ACC2XG18_9TREE|nr:hypothetical protein QFC22_001747 [Naganishia vaughanmartiniae]
MDLLHRYRLAASPLPTHLQEQAPSRKTKEAEAELYLKNQRKVRHGLKLYSTLTAEELPVYYENLNNLDFEHDIQPQERPRLPEVIDAARNDSGWEVGTESNDSEAPQGGTSTAIGKRLIKVYRFPSWTLASRHFWKRMDESFEAQDHHAEVNIRFIPDTKMTEVRVAINTHSPRALPPPLPVDHSKPSHSASESAAEKGQPAEKRRIEYGPPALTRKDFILAWSIDMAAFRARQREITLEQRRARRTARKELEEAGQQEHSHSELSISGGDISRQPLQSSSSGSVARLGAETGESSSSIKPPISPAQHTLPNGVSTSDVHNNTTSTSSAAPIDLTKQEIKQTSDIVALKSETKKDTRKRRLGGDGLSLQHFLSRTQILAAYRNSVRATKTLPDSHTRRETLDWLRRDLEKLRGVTDLPTIKEAISAYRRDSKHFIPSVGLSTSSGDDHITARLVGRK